MSTLTILLIIAVLVVAQVVGLAVIFGWFRRQMAKGPEDTGAMVLLQNRIDDLGRILDDKLDKVADHTRETARDQFDRSQRLMTDITKQVSDQLMEVVKGVSATQESTKQVFTIADQLRNLESVLKNQKQRGNLGEASLELILSNVLPGQYKSQYAFKNGEIVDFVVQTKEGLIPVDAKFPLENYMRLINEADTQRRQQYERDFKKDVKEKIDQTAKYIRPEEGTLPFAFMFIPGEGIFTDLMNNEVGTGINAQDLMEYARYKRNVHITSPATFVAFLQTVLFGNQRLQIQEAAKDIIKNVAELGKHLKSYEASHLSLGKSLTAAFNHYESSGKSFRAIDKDVLKIADETMGLAHEPIDRPLLPEA